MPRTKPLSDLIQRVDGATPIAGGGGVAVSGITADSRRAGPGMLFVAVRGTQTDGHRFIADAVARGAAAVVFEQLPFGVSAPVMVQCPDTKLALGRMADALYEDPSRRLTLVGVTGTNGKTTTVHLIRSIVCAGGQPCGMAGTVCYDDCSGAAAEAVTTTPDAVTLRELMAGAADAGARTFAMEASSHALDQGRTDLLDFDAAVFTNLSGDHLDYHGNIDAYAAAKSRLFESLKPEATAIVNGDDRYAQRMVRDCPAPVVRFGFEASNGLVAENLDLTIDGSAFDAVSAEGRLRVSLRTIGRHNVSNALAAVGACRAIGIDDATIVRGLAGAEGVPGRLQRVNPQDDFAVFVDYAHTDKGLESVLEALRPFTAGRLICVFGCGGDRDRTKRPRMGDVVSRLADIAVVTNDNPRSEDPSSIARQVTGGMVGPAERCVVLDRAKAIDLAIGRAEPDDVVLIAGKGHETYQIFKDGRRHFDDVESAREALSRRRTTA